MLNDLLKDYNIILASGSPRRQEFFKSLHIDFVVDVRKVNEMYPKHFKAAEITDHIAELKAAAFSDLQENDILITSDTVVWIDQTALEKPTDFDEAFAMLKKLSGRMHEVITSVCFTSKNYQKTVHDTTKVWFKELTDAEIEHYIKTYKPFDKAGSYGIQEWIGYIGVEKIEGCYFNVMGLPTRLVYKVLSSEFSS